MFAVGAHLKRWPMSGKLAFLFFLPYPLKEQLTYHRSKEVFV